ncbi:MAG: hypothetical protein H6744_16180 [Deltaproteobacteria bacterium]|nr:hypothetical protein [Deltaproteobacteria bacterium]MCB9788221.1 hypothetical protein [Deltaproteobacteria bacterium]
MTLHGSAALSLTLPTDAAASTRRTTLRFLKRLARDTLRLPPALFSEGAAEAARVVHERVAWFGEHAPAALFSVLRRPNVHVLLTTALRSLEEGDSARARDRAEAYALQLVFELACDGRLGTAVRFEARTPLAALASPNRRLYLALPEGTTRLTLRDGAVELPGGERLALDPAPSERFLPVAAGMVLSLEDNNPISDFEAHPDKQGNQLDLGSAPAERWVESLQAGLALIERHMPELRHEMDLLLQQFVPVGTDDERHLSASYREAIGTVYLTLHPRLMTMTEAIVHEYQHNKLNALFHLDAVMDNAWWPLFRSPVRPDPRPLHGVLLAAHAFVPVAELYLRMLEADAPEAGVGGFRERLQQIVAKNDEALQVLQQHAEPTAHGAQVIDELSRLHDAHRAQIS